MLYEVITVINEVMFVVWQKAATVEQRSRVSTWILGIAHYKALQSLRRSTPSAGMPFDENRITSYNVCYTKLLRCPPLGK